MDLKTLLIWAGIASIVPLFFSNSVTLREVVRTRYGHGLAHFLRTRLMKGYGFPAVSALIPRRYHPYWKLRRLIEKSAGGLVISGPFQGLALPPKAGVGVHYAKLLGTYELELHSVVQEIITKEFANIVNIGAAEGYYACGFARTMPSVRVTAFEGTVTERYILQQTIDKNRLKGRVIVKGFCDLDQLNACLNTASAPVLIFCDVDGLQFELLDPVCLTQLKRAIILVEVHDYAMDGLSQLLKQRFSRSHEIREIHPRPRRREDFPIDSPGMWWIPRYYFNWFTGENRPGQNFWLWMIPETRPIAPQLNDKIS